MQVCEGLKSFCGLEVQMETKLPRIKHMPDPYLIASHRIQEGEKSRIQAGEMKFLRSN